jgi:hypothetical protein
MISTDLKSKRRFKLSTLILAVILLLILFVPAVAQEEISGEEEEPEGLSMQAVAVFGPNVRQDQYFPVRVTIENNGPARRGEIRVVSQDPLKPLSAFFTARCEIPSNSRKVYYLYPYFLNTDMTPSVYVQYVEGSPLISQVLELNMMQPSQRLWVEVADEGSDFIFLSGVSLPEGSSFSEISKYVAEEQSTSYPYGGRGYNQPMQYDTARSVLAWTRPENLPDRVEGYETIDGIILNTRRFYELSTDQREALAEWVISGGSVIVWLGDDPARFQGSFLTGSVDGSGMESQSAITEMPVRTTIQVLRTVPGFSGRTDVIGDFPVTYAPQESARTLFAEGNVPVLQHLTYGRGDILLSGLDLAALKTANPTGLDQYMGFMMGYLMSTNDAMLPLIKYSMTGYPAWRGDPYDQTYVERSEYNVLSRIDNALQSEQLTALPPLSAIATFLIIYIIVVGPINYFVLLKMRRREWLWYTIPLVVTFFIIVSYSWALGTKGSRLLLTRVNVVDSFPGQETAWESSYFGLFSPVGRRYRVELTDGQDLIRRLELPRPAVSRTGIGQENISSEPFTIIQDSDNAESFIADAYIRIWSEAHFASEGAIDPPGNAWLEDVAVSGNHLTGTLNYSIPERLEDPFLLYYTPRGYVNMQIMAGPTGRNFIEGSSSMEFDLNLDVHSSLPLPSTPRRLSNSKSATLRSVSLDALSTRVLENSPDNEIMLCGWVSDGSARAIGRPGVRSSVEETLVITHLPLEIEDGSFIWEGARGHILGLQASQMEIDQSGSLAVYDGRLLYSITFPVDSPSRRPENVRITRSGSAYKDSATTTMYSFNHTNSRWQSLPIITNSVDSISYGMNNLGQYLAPDGRTIFLMLEDDPSTFDDVFLLNGISINAR